MMSELRLDHTPTPSQEPSQDQEQSQSQRLIVSQKHQQAIELLQYPIQELSQWVNEQLQENPLLEIQREDDHPEQPEVTETEETEHDPLEEVNLDELINPGEDYTVQYGGSGAGQDDPEFQFRAMASQHQTLHDSLEWQLSLRNLSDEEHELAEHLLSYIDEDGLFQGDLNDLSQELNTDKDRLEEILETIQEFDPPGVGGRSLEEVLLIQLRRQEDDLEEHVTEIVGEHLENLQNRYFSKISDEVGVDKNTVQDVADRVGELEPRPGRVHEPVNRKYITPDVKIRELDDDFAVIINEEAPPLNISSKYKALLDSGDEETREYVEDKLKGALWIIHCIHQRHETLYKVTKSIAVHQSDFFDQGVEALKPLVLQDIAQDVGVHESTVSRAVQNKHVQTSRGLYPLDFFFSSKLETSGDGDAVASTAVKAQIREMIKDEDSTDPLSDREIMEKLNERGVEIKRRTISKYRKEMLIPPWKLRQRVD
jgi:RNA polymerase sigma-54 factor